MALPPYQFHENLPSRSKVISGGQMDRVFDKPTFIFGKWTNKNTDWTCLDLSEIQLNRVQVNEVPTLLYGSENWTIKAIEVRRITAAEMKYMRSAAGTN
jgi:hypothetical protein